jgi:hypothetical protein
MINEWMARWPEALRAWGRFVTVHDPLMCTSDKAAKAEGLSGSFAMFRLDDRTVVLNLAEVASLGLGDLPVEVMAHEVGHHVLCPADLADSGRLISRIRRALPNLESHAPMIANMYADLLINDRLQRSRGLRMDQVYARLGSTSDSLLWTFYLRTYEILWSLTRGTLAPAGVDPALDGDAQLGAKLVRVYAADWLTGAGGFAMLCYRYLAEDSANGLAGVRRRVCVAALGGDAQVSGLTAGDVGEIVHPALDPLVNDFAEGAGDAGPDEPPVERPSAPSGGQYREPFEYGQILRQLGLNVSDEDAAMRCYRERAAPHLVRFPVRERRDAGEPLPEGVGPWDVGEPLESVDWLATTLRSPVVIPGVTTVQRLHGLADGAERDPRPVDLDLYIDSSASMPNPRSAVSYLTLAGATLALSALRVGAAVQATLWSGTNQFRCTDGFVRDEAAVLRILTGFFGGATAFPLHVLRETYRDGRRTDRPTHIVVISDDGVDTMFHATDEQGLRGADIAAVSLAAAAAGGTLVLNLWSDAQQERITTAAVGWHVHRVNDWPDLVDFATTFSRRHYGSWSLLGRVSP